MFTGAALFGNLLFSAIGFVAFIYGKKQELLKTMLLGLLLMLYPYFVPNVTALYLVGAALTAAVFFFRD